MRVRRVVLLLALLVIGLSFLVPCKNQAILRLQHSMGIVSPFRVGDAAVSPDSDWVLLGSRTARGQQAYAFGIFPPWVSGFEESRLPQSAYYSFRRVSGCDSVGEIGFLAIGSAEQARARELIRNRQETLDGNAVEFIRYRGFEAFSYQSAKSAVIVIPELAVQIVAPPHVISEIRIIGMPRTPSVEELQ